MNLSSILRGTAAATLGVSLAAISFAGGIEENTPRLSAIESYGKLPLRFEASSASGRFAARGLGYGLWLEADGATIVLRGAGPRTAALRMRLVGGSTRAAARTDGELAGRSHYMVGPREAWRTDVRGFERVRFDGVYDGVDVVYYGNQGRLEYDFIAAPGAEPDAIRIGLEGSQGLSVDATGALVIAVPGGELRLEAPVAFQ